MAVANEPMARVPAAVQWALLFGTSALLALGLEMAGLAAAFLLGPMIAGILLGVNGCTIRISPVPYLGAQAIIGLMVAQTVTPSIVTSFLRGWPLFLSVVLSTIVVSSVVGWLLSRWRVMPGTTGIWGCSPGAAAAMVVMAEEYGSDVKLVAFMQYLRVVCVAVTASLMARFWVDPTGLPRPEMIWFPTIHWLAFGETLVVAVIGPVVGRRFRIPSGALLVPLVAGTVLQASGLAEIQLPAWLLAVTFAVLGWYIGLSFTRKALSYAFHTLPQMLLSIAVLIVFCGGLAVLLTRTLGVDLLTAYLATSPGGLDSIVIITASTNADISFVMVLQSVRLFAVILLGPSLARIVARHTNVG